jgi:hypothetical protein
MAGKKALFMSSCGIALLSMTTYGAEVFVEPIGASGSHTIVGNQIILDVPGQLVTLEIRLDDWNPVGDIGICLDQITICDMTDPEPCPFGDCYQSNGLLQAYQATIDSSGYIDFLNNHDAFIDTNNPEQVFYGLPQFALVNTTTDDYRFGSVMQDGPSAPAYAGVDKYLGTLVIDAPSGVAGEFTVALIDDLTLTFLRDNNSIAVVPIETAPAIITILCEFHSDCSDYDECTDDTCNLDGSCSNDNNYDDTQYCCDPETGFLTVIDDNNDCTDDICNPDGTVDHIPYDLGTPCGDPPGYDCDAQDTCDGNGNCIERFAEPGTPCGDPDDNECTDPDTCDAIGNCEPNHEPFGTPCGDPDDTDCTDPDTCDGQGTCDPNHEDPGTPCGDPSDTQCDNPDTCDADGECQGNHEPNGTPCDDGEYCNVGEDCTNGYCTGGTARDCGDGIPCTTDTCDDDIDECVNTLDDGYCLINGICYTHGTVNPGNECEECNWVLSTTDWSFKPEGAACGDPDDNECTDPDTCDGQGTCDPNHEPYGTPCGDPSDTQCDNPDHCSGYGTCMTNNEPNGTPCDDGEYCNVGEDCRYGYCTGGEDRDCSDGVGCTDDSCDEVNDECDNDPNDANCNDGQYCNGIEICDAELDCIIQPGSVPDCDDEVQCTDDSCDEVNDECDNDPNDANCNDGQYCNGVEICDPVDDCIVESGSVPDCDDEFECTDDSCDEANDECDNDPNDGLCPDDGLWCNGDEICDPENPDPELPVSGCGHGPEPCGGPCDEENDVCLCDAPIVEGVASRYMIITPQPPESEAPMALMVTGDCPDGLTQYVSAPVPFSLDGDPIPEAMLGFLVDEPVFLKPVDWGGTVYVTGEALAPGTSYIVTADCGTPGNPGLSEPSSATSWDFADTNNDHVMSIGDVLDVVNGFIGNYGATSLERVDLLGEGAVNCLPNQFISILDVLQAVNAFTGNTAADVDCPDLLCP